MDRQATEAEEKLKYSDYDGERKDWDLDKYVVLHKEHHAIMESLTDYGKNEKMMTQRSTTFSKPSRALNWWLWSMLSVPN